MKEEKVKQKSNSSNNYNNQDYKYYEINILFKDNDYVILKEDIGES